MESGSASESEDEFPFDENFIKSSPRGNDDDDMDTDDEYNDPEFNGMIKEEALSECESFEDPGDFPAEQLDLGGTEVAPENKKQVEKKGPSKPRRRRGRPREGEKGLNIISEDSLSDSEANSKLYFQRGIGYTAEFKLKVITYSETHSNSATAKKFGLTPKRIREWRQTKDKIEDEKKGVKTRRAKPDGFTVREKLQAIAFAAERSIDEARLLYNVDRRTIGKWRARKEELEQRLQRGEGDMMAAPGPRRKPKYTAIEGDLRDWVVALRLKGITVHYKMIFNKAEELVRQTPSLKDIPPPKSNGWISDFLRKYNLQGLLGNTYGHEDPRELLDAQFTSSDLSSKTFENEAIDIPMNPNKRNKRTISAEDKVKIIRRIELGEPQGTVAKTLRLPTSTVQTIWSNRTDILQRYLSPKHKARSDALVWKENKAISVILKDWYDSQIKKGYTVNCEGLMTKAVEIADTYKLTPRFHHEGKQWLRVFCKKFNYRDILMEIRGIPPGASIPISNITKPSVQPQSAPEAVVQGEDSCGHQTTADDFHSTDFFYNDPLPSERNDHVGHASQHSMSPAISQPGMQSPLESPHSVHTPPLSSTNNQTPSVAASKPSSASVSSLDALNHISFLRSWIQCNFGNQEEVLNTHLSMVENAVLKKRVAEMNNLPLYHSNR